MTDGWCTHCGTARLRALNRRERLVGWVQSGHGAGDVRCEGCGATRGSSGWYRLGRQGLGPRERLRQLPQLWRYLHHVRTWDPTPLFYSYVTAGGLVVGGVAAAITRQRWLLGATPLAAFLTTFAIAARPVISRRGLEVAREFVDPIGSHRRELAHQATALRAQHGRLPVLAPANWDGPVRLVGIRMSSETDGPLRAVTVAAEPREGHERVPFLLLRTQPAGEFDREDAVLEVAYAEVPDPSEHELRPEASVGNGAADLLGFQKQEPEPERVAELREAWRDTRLALDGAPVAASLLTGHRAQVAVLHLDGHVVEITGHGVDLEHVPLHRPADLEPLIAAYETGHQHG